MTAALRVEVGGQVADLRKCSWVFRGSCGCAYGVSMAQTDHRVYATEDQAWEGFEPNRIQRERDRLGGDTTTLMLTSEAIDALQRGCDHEPKYGRAETPIPEGHVWAASDAWRARPRFRHLVPAPLPRDHKSPHRLFPWDHGKVPALCKRSETRDWSDAPWVADDLPECSACQKAASERAA